MKLINLPNWDNLPSREDVFSQIVETWHFERQTESVLLEQAKGRVCANDMCSSVTLPVVRSSMADGVAVISKLFKGGIPDTSAWVLGEDFDRADTGDDFDDKFDAVIMIEDVDLTLDGKLTIHEGVPVKAGDKINGAGSTIKRGEVLARRNEILRTKTLAGLAMGGHTNVHVQKKPIVAFIPTGSELIKPGTPLTRGKNYDSNSLLAKLTMEELGAEMLNYPIISDDKQKLKEAMDEALTRADIVVLNGGSSKGGEDFTSQLLHESGKNICHGAAMTPGKPICVSIINDKLVINLPGPFMAAYNGMEWFLNMAISHYLGQPRRLRPTVRVTLTEDIKGTKDISLLCAIDVTRKRDGSGYWGTPYFIRQLPMWRAIAANAQYMTILGGEGFSKGSEIEVELLCTPDQIPLADE